MLSEVDNKERYKASKPKATFNDYLRVAFIMTLVLGLGMTAVNQTFQYLLTTNNISNSCDMCRAFNPEIDTYLKQYEMSSEIKYQGINLSNLDYPTN